MNIHLTSKQLTRLDEFNARHDTSWGITDIALIHIGPEPEKRELLEVSIDAYSPGRSFTRYLDNAGNVYRYDADTDKWLTATVEPLEGSYRVTNVNGTMRTKTFNY